MANTNYPLLKLYVDTVPHFDGNPYTLGVFLDACESLIVQFSVPNNNSAPINSFILRAIIGKLTGRALSLIGSRTELTTWLEIKNLLQLCFGDQRNLDCLVQDLIALQPFRNETPYNFGMRCQDARSLIVAKINASQFSAEEKRIRLLNYDELALKTFIRCLTGQLQNNIRLRNPNSLEQAMSLVIEEENFLYSTQRINLINSQNFKPSQRITPSNARTNISQPHKVQYQAPLQRPSNSNNFGNNNYRNNFQNRNFQNNFKPAYQFNNTFSRQNNNVPISNNFSRPPMLPQENQQSSFNNFRNFNQNQNHFTRNSSQITRNTNFNRPTYNPEPMDTSSRNTIIKNHHLNLQNFGEFQKPFENPYDRNSEFPEKDNLATVNEYVKETFDTPGSYQEQCTNNIFPRSTYFNENLQGQSCSLPDNENRNFRVVAPRQPET